VKISFYVSGHATRLLKILDKLKEQEIADFVLVISDSNRNRLLPEKCAEKGIDYFFFDYDGLEGRRSEKNKRLSDFILNKFVDYRIDYCFCFGDHILVGDLLLEYKNRIINFHPSVLPLFPGRKAIDQAVENNAFFLGNTAHFIDEGVDTGPIIMQNFLSRNHFDITNYDKILDNQIIMFQAIYGWLKQDRLRVIGNKVEIDDYTSEYNCFFIPNIDENR
jgi:phosphoribosylglycinamide formyltransferase-1